MVPLHPLKLSPTSYCVLLMAIRSTVVRFLLLANVGYSWTRGLKAIEVKAVPIPKTIR